IVFCTAAAYALSKLKPVFGTVILGGILATLMVPVQALVVPKYLTIADLPLIHVNLLNDPLAIWLPAVANAFNLYLLKRFFDQIPRDVLEAAEIDGAGRVRQFFHITLPQLRNAVITSMILMVVGGLTTFDTVLILTQGGPGSDTTISAFYMYQKAFKSFDYGAASAIALLLVLVSTL
ncbi:ABC transporter permease subunit, partial [Streptomyces sp. NPDC056295]|uniref:ABC transporter permease subunit n=1 Tax=Streptomyces sp. NPDC056295 TaxID=3345774 RepID=UPI0035DFE2DE